MSSVRAFQRNGSRIPVIIAILMVLPSAGGVEVPDVPAPTADDVTAVLAFEAAFEPSTVEAEQAPTPRAVTLTIPADTPLPYDRIVVTPPAGFSFEVANVTVDGVAATDVTATYFNEVCQLTNAVEPAWYAHNFEDAASGLPPPQYSICDEGDATAITFNRASPDAEVTIGLVEFIAPRVAGAHAFDVALSLTLGGAITRSAEALDALLPDAVGEAVFRVRPGPVVTFEMHAPLSAVAGSALPGNVTLSVRDVYGNAQSEFTGNVTLVTSDAAATIPTNVAFSAVDGGIKDLAGSTFTFRTMGAQTLTASLANGMTNTTTIGVSAGALSTFTLTCTPTSAVVASAISCEATDGFDSSGNPVALTSVDWSVKNATWAVIANTSAFNAPTTVAHGPLRVNATAASVLRSANITLVPAALDHVTFTSAPNQTNATTPVSFAAQARDEFENPLPDAVAYSIGSGPGAIDATSGLFTPSLTGTTSVRAESGALAATTSIVTVPGALESVAFTLAPTATDADTPVDFDAEARDAQGNAIDLPLTYSIVSGSGAIDESTGDYTPNATGAVVVRASTSGGVNATSTLNVVPGALDEIVFTAAPEATDADTPVTFAAEPRDALGNLRADGIAYTILSGPGGISAAGVFTPDAVGISVVQAANGTTVATASIETSVGALDQVAFTLAPATTDADTPVTFAAEAQDAQGNTLEGAITYELVSGSGALDATTGLYTPNATGPAVIRASLESGLDATTTLVVTPGALHHLVTLAAPSSTAADVPATFAVVGEDALNNRRADAPAYSIVSGSGSIGAASGIFTPDAVGTTVVRADLGALHATFTLTVTTGALARIDVVGPAATDADTPVTFSATPRDSRGNARGDGITFSIANGSGSIGELTGIFTPASAGTTQIRASANGAHADVNISVTPGAATFVFFTDAPLATNVETPVIFAAKTSDARGNLRNETVVYSIRAGSGAIDAAGRFTPNAVGVTTIGARAGNLFAETRITVAPGAPVRVYAEAVAASVVRDDPFRVTFGLTDARGNLVTEGSHTLTLTGTGAGELNGTKVRATAQGRITFEELKVSRVGRYTITASSPGLASASVAFDVVDPTPPPPPPAPVVIVPGPVARFTSSDSPTANASVTLEAEVDPLRPSALYEWTFGDGGSATGRVVTHTWVAPGEYAVHLIVSSGNLQGSSLRVVNVGAAIVAPPPVEEAAQDADEDPSSDVTSDADAPPAPLPVTLVSAPTGLTASPATVSFDAGPGTVVYWRSDGSGWHTSAPAIIAGEGAVNVEFYAIGPGGREATRSLTLDLDGLAPQLAGIAIAEGGVSASVSDAHLTSVEARVLDASGALVATIPLVQGTSTARAASLAGIPPGDYTIEIVARDALGRETVESAGEYRATDTPLEESAIAGADRDTPFPWAILPLAVGLAALLAGRRKENS